MVCLMNITLWGGVNMYIMNHIGCMPLQCLYKVMHLYAYRENKLQPHAISHFDH